MLSDIHRIATKLWRSFLDLAPILAVVIFFQVIVIGKPFPEVGEIIFGSILVILGLMIFVEGLEQGLFPIGESLAYALVREGNLAWLLIFSFLLGFSTTIAEPALIAVSQQAADISATSGIIAKDSKTMSRYALGLRLSVAFAVGLSILVGVLRILRGWPLQYLIIGGYLMVMLMTIVAPKEIVGLAYDAGGITTSTITVPLVTALGIGMANIIKGRDPLIDGFGLIAFASLAPMIFVMAYGLFWFR